MTSAADWTLVTGPTQEPVTLAEAKLQCRVDGDDENVFIAGLIPTARALAESAMRRPTLTQTWKTVFPGWADVLYLPMAAPLQSVSSVQYYDTAGTLQTLNSSSYVVDTTSEPARLLRAPNVTYPTLQADRAAAVVVTYVVGWTTAAAVPATIRHLVKLLVAHFYRHRGDTTDTLPAAAEALVQMHRVIWREPVSL